MVSKLKIIFISLLGLFLISGCGVRSIKVNNPLTQDEIIAYIENKISIDMGDKVTAKIISKNNLKVCTSWFDTCLRYQTVDGGYSYQIEIVNNDNKEIVATGTYDDGYIKYDKQYTNGKQEKESYFINNYKEKKGLFLIKNEFTNILNQSFNKYFIYKDLSNDNGYDIFINSIDYDLINNLLLNFNKIVTKYRDYVYTSFSVYIYKDGNIYNNTNFELYNNGKKDYSGQSYGKDMIEQYTGKEVVRIGESDAFNRELFLTNGASAANTDNEYIDYNNFEYLIFWYHSEPNASYHNGSTQIFGIK